MKCAPSLDVFYLILEGALHFLFFQKTKDYRGIVSKRKLTYDLDDENSVREGTYIYHNSDENLFFYDKTEYGCFGLEENYKSHTNVNGTSQGQRYSKERGWLIDRSVYYESDNAFIYYDYGYNPQNGNLTSISTMNNSLVEDEMVKTSNQFDYAKGLLSKVTHNGSQYRFTYDGLGRIKNISIGAQNLMDISYTQEEGTTIQTIDYATKYAEEQKRFEVISDACGNPVMKKYNGEPLSTASYDVFGKPVQVVDKVKDSTYNYSYDRYGNVICVKETDNTTKSEVDNTFTYVEGQLPESKTYGATGHTYTMLYEENGGKRYPDNVPVGVTLNGKFTDKIERDSFGRPIRRTLKDASGFPYI